MKEAAFPGQVANPLNGQFVEQALQLAFPERYYRHPLLHTITVYTREEMYKPRAVHHYGDSYAQGYIDPLYDEQGNQLAQPLHPHSEVIARRLEKHLNAGIEYANRARGGNTIQNAIDQIKEHTSSPDFNPALDRDVFISAGGVDLLHRCVTNHDVLMPLTAFFKDPLHNMGPIPSLLTEQIRGLAQDYRRMLEYVAGSPYHENIRRLNLSLLPNGSKIDIGKADLLAVNEYDRAHVKTNAVGRRVVALVDYFRKAGTQLANATLLKSIEEFMTDHGNDLDFEVMVFDPFTVIRPNEYGIEHPLPVGHDKLAAHYLGRVYLEGGRRSLAEM